MTAKKELFQTLSSSERSNSYTLRLGSRMNIELSTFLYSKIKAFREEMIAINHNLLITIAIQEQPEIKEFHHLVKEVLLTVS